MPHDWLLTGIAGAGVGCLYSISKSLENLVKLLRDRPPSRSE